MIRLASNDNDVSLRLAFCAAEYEMNIVTNVFDLLENQNHIKMRDENIITFFFSFDSKFSEKLFRWNWMYNNWLDLRL